MLLSIPTLWASMALICKVLQSSRVLILWKGYVNALVHTYSVPIIAANDKLVTIRFTCYVHIKTRKLYGIRWDCPYKRGIIYSISLWCNAARPWPISAAMPVYYLIQEPTYLVWYLRGTFLKALKSTPGFLVHEEKRLSRAMFFFSVVLNKGHIISKPGDPRVLDSKDRTLRTHCRDEREV